MTNGNYSLGAKNEILAQGFSTECCKAAFLSGVIHSAGSVIISGGSIKIVIPTENNALFSKIKKLTEIYGIVPEFSGKEISLCGDGLEDMLIELGIFEPSDEGIKVNPGISVSVISSDCCRVNYLKGAFIGAGSVTVKSNYHLEFALSSKDMADGVLHLLKGFSVNAKSAKRKDKFLAYVKDSQSVSDCLALMGAGEAVLLLNNEYVLRQVRCGLNRVNNCELANLDKTVNVSVRQADAIKFLKRHKKMGSLDDKLYEVAAARLKNPSMSYSELAEKLNITKSTLRRRLGKIVESAEKFGFGE